MATTSATSEQEHWKAIESAAGQNVVSGGVYELLLAHCALKSGARTIYTWNVKHFNRLGSDASLRVTTP